MSVLAWAVCCRSERVRHVYVHAGGKIEALGTGMWAAPRGTAGVSGTAGELVETSSATGMMTVETVCAVDVRDNTLPSSSLFGETMSTTPRQAQAASIGVTAPASSTSANPGTTTVKKDKKTEERERREAEKQAKLAEREAKRKEVCSARGWGSE